MVDRSTLFQHSINLIIGTSSIVYVHGVRVRDGGGGGRQKGRERGRERETGRVRERERGGGAVKYQSTT